MKYYDFDGKPIDEATWRVLFGSSERFFGKEEINGHTINTAWVGIDYGFGTEPPLIFESMVFCELHTPEHGTKWCDWNNNCRRYATKEEAILGHAILCNDVTGERHDA